METLTAVATLSFFIGFIFGIVLTVFYAVMKGIT